MGQADGASSAWALEAAAGTEKDTEVLGVAVGGAPISLQQDRLIAGVAALQQLEHLYDPGAAVALIFAGRRLVSANC